jgi:hypothetical protein
VNDALHIFIFLEDGKRIVEIAQIDLVIFDSFAGYFLDAFQDNRIGSFVIIYRNNIVTIFNQINNRVRTDVTASPCDQNLSHLLNLNSGKTLEIFSE